MLKDQAILNDMEMGEENEENLVMDFGTDD